MHQICGDRQTPRHRLYDTSLQHLERLIAFPSVSRDSNLDLIAYVRDFLAGLGIASTLVHNEDGRKANLWATIGPADAPGIVLSGHTDVVPVEGQAWSPIRSGSRSATAISMAAARRT